MIEMNSVSQAEREVSPRSGAASKGELGLNDDRLPPKDTGIALVHLLELLGTRGLIGPLAKES